MRKKSKNPFNIRVLTNDTHTLAQGVTLGLKARLRGEV